MAFTVFLALVYHHELIYYLFFENLASLSLTFLFFKKLVKTSKTCFVFIPFLIFLY